MKAKIASTTMVFHFSWKTHTFEVFDSQCKKTETPKFEDHGVSHSMVNELCTALNKKFNNGALPCIATPTQIQMKGKKLQNKKTGQKSRVVHFRCSSNLLPDSAVSAPCGEASCMELLALLDPSLKENPIWTDTHHHRAYVISEWIKFIILPPTSAPAPMAMEGDAGFQPQMRLLRQVMELDFGSSETEIFEAVCKGYSCWGSEKCPKCEKNVYDAKKSQDLIIRCCCGDCVHVSCFQYQLENADRIPNCLSTACIDNAEESPFKNEFIYIGQNFECVACFSGGSYADLTRFIAENKKEVDRIDRRECKKLWKKWTYLQDGTLPYEECKHAGSKRSSVGNDCRFP